MKYTIVDSMYLLENGLLFHPMHEVAVGYMTSRDAKKIPWRSQIHGPYEKVEYWANQARKSLSLAGKMGRSLSSEIHIVSGKIKVEDLNMVLEDKSKIFVLLKNSFDLDREERIIRNIRVDGVEIQKIHLG